MAEEFTKKDLEEVVQLANAVVSHFDGHDVGIVLETLNVLYSSVLTEKVGAWAAKKLNKTINEIVKEFTVERDRRSIQ